jgi:hypothetical protein
MLTDRSISGHSVCDLLSNAERLPLRLTSRRTASWRSPHGGSSTVGIVADSFPVLCNLIIVAIADNFKVTSFNRTSAHPPLLRRSGLAAALQAAVGLTIAHVRLLACLARAALESRQIIGEARF